MGAWSIDIYVITSDLPMSRQPRWMSCESDRLVRRGEGSSGFKRDPWACELGTDPPYPDCDCLVRDPNTYPWHDSGFHPPPFYALIYQLHVSVFYGVDEHGRDKRTGVAKFLDVVTRIPWRSRSLRAQALAHQVAGTIRWRASSNLAPLALPLQVFPLDDLAFNPPATLGERQIPAQARDDG